MHGGEEGGEEAGELERDEFQLAPHCHRSYTHSFYSCPAPLSVDMAYKEGSKRSLTDKLAAVNTSKPRSDEPTFEVLVINSLCSYSSVSFCIAHLFLSSASIEILIDPIVAMPVINGLISFCITPSLSVVCRDRGSN